MKCPHCLTEFHDRNIDIDLGRDIDGDWAIRKNNCPSPNCKRDIYYLINGEWFRTIHGGLISADKIKNRELVRPKTNSRSALPPEIPDLFREEFNEACSVLCVSAKASAALSRRCLQLLLREKAGIKHDDLAREIQQVIDSKQLPTHLRENIDAIRNIGNFAAHPSKSKSTGEIVTVEPGEAEWNLDVIELLFDFYFVQPERSKQKQEALNKKLNDLGKPEMK
ncbi:MAG: DUF4145 domain-containing protein [Limnohabitans sp.]|nr:DUF4145 domain-containing protein [Limnohabitans sp.]